ncbi:MAG: penicillin-binding protein 2 [Patescibacteria group bacterium]
MSNQRASIVFIAIIIGFISVVLKLFYWQVVASDRLKTEASLQHFIEFSLPAIRGNIVDRDDNQIVVNKPAYLVFAEPRLIPDPHEFSKVIAPIIGLTDSEVFEKVSDPTSIWAPLIHRADGEMVKMLKALNLSSLGFEKEPLRLYPEASTASQMLGFVGSDVNGVDHGYFGLEGYYDRQLRGVTGKLRLEKDAQGVPILIGDQQRVEPENGRTLVLWSEKAVQEIVERRLKEGMEKYGAKEGSVVLMDPKTGGVLAMASYPNYDPTNFQSFPKEYYKNPIVASSFEPGSTFKSLVMAAALDHKLITPQTMMDETGPVQIGPYFIRTWNNEYHGPILMTQVLEYSSNVGMVFVAKKLGHDKFLSAIKRFGFGEPTHIDLEDESSPTLRDDDAWAEVDELTASFGQGIAVTPIQMVAAVAALANGGKLMEPHVVKEIRDDNGRVIPVKSKVVRQVISEEAARIIGEMMVEAVDNGEAKWAKPKGYRIAGKTGTAQIPVAGHYDETKTIASFVGFAPVDNPKFVMLVTLREPQSSQWGSETAAPLFFAISRELFTYYGIGPQN